METKRLKNSIVEGGGHHLSAAMMSYCIIRSKLKRAKRHEECPREIHGTCSGCAETGRAKVSQSSHLLTANNRCANHREPSPAEQFNQAMETRQVNCEMSPAYSQIATAASLSAASASQTKTTTRVRDGLNNLSCSLASALLNSSSSANNTCQPNKESSLEMGPLFRPAERGLPARGNKCPSGPVRLQFPSSWAVLVALLLLSLSLAGQQRPHWNHQQHETIRSEDDNILNTVYESIASAIGSIVTRQRGFVLLADAQQYRPEWPSKSLQQEIFLLNLEDGYFGCQVNESQDFLQLFELSRLCDGQAQCYLGTDEMASPLKCSNRERCGTDKNSRTGQQESYQCVNGVCLDGLCYCNDGFGGKSCDVPDENECKFRPCDVFAHCTNTMGSYYCSCFPGYDGDGIHCQDINECEIPSLAALCSDNSECCNLPGHFVCKCKPGFQQASQSQSSLTAAPNGNTTVICTDIDECLDERTCGRGASCENLPGSFACSCPPGFTGDPLVECIDMDECRNNPCGVGAQCTNIPGGYRCSCAPGFERNPTLPANLFGTIQLSASTRNQANEMINSSLVACLDVNECTASGPNGKPVCGSGAQCINTPGGFFCQCPPNYTGNPKVACLDVDECAAHVCGPNTQCKNTPGSYKCECKQGYTGDAYLPGGCQDEDECLRKDACGVNAQCFNTLGSFECTCPSGFAGDPYTKCADIDECTTQNPCGPGAQCLNLQGGYKCACPDKYLARGTPEMGCERAAVDIGCAGDYDCTKNALCLNSTCQCKLGYQINGIECVDVDECSQTSTVAPPQPPVKAFTRTNIAALNYASNSSMGQLGGGPCGLEASCQNTDGSYRCECRAGYEKLDQLAPTSKCRDIDECNQPTSPCGQNSNCFNTEGSYKCLCGDGFIPIEQDPANGCKSPCDGVNCGQHATCKQHGEEVACVCKPGFTFVPNNIKLGCVDINECDTAYGPAGLCGQNAACTNIPGSYRCHCPSGFTGDGYKFCEDVNECDRKFGVFGQCGELAVCNNTAGSYTCSCAAGYAGDPRNKCLDVDECSTSYGPAGKCGVNALCTNTPGKFSCRCPTGFSGDPYTRCVQDQPACLSSADCPTNQLCQSGRCTCPFNQQQQSGPEGPSVAGECRHPCDRTECGLHATCQLDNENQAICVCESGYMAPSDGRSGCVDVNECIQGISLSGITPLSALTSGRGGVALGPSASTLAPGGQPTGNSSHPCGRNAICRNQPGSFDCVCPPGHAGNAYEACTMEVRNQQVDQHELLQQQRQTTTTTTVSTSTTSNAAVTNSNGLFGNYQQEPRTTACSESCPGGHICSDGLCIKPDICRDNQDCKPHTTCEKVNNALGFQCVNPCELTQCGPETKCQPLNHRGVCFCNPGFTGDPYDLDIGCRQPLYDFTKNQQQQQTNNLSSKHDLSDAHKTTVSSAHQQHSDLSTISVDFGSQPANQYQPPIKTGLTTASISAANNSLQEQLQRQQQMYELQQEQQAQTKRPPNQPLGDYDLPMPTTPSFGQNSLNSAEHMTSSVSGQQQQDSTQANKQTELRQTNQQLVQTPLHSTVNPQLTQTTIVNQLTSTTGSRQQQQQQTTTTQNLFSNKRKQPQQQVNVISNNQLNTANRQVANVNENLQQQQDFDKSQKQQSKEQLEQLQLQIQQQQHQQQQDEILQSFNQFGNKSTLITNYVFNHKQVTCTSDQHCPGNLICLESLQQQQQQQSSKLAQKICGCPTGYKREADYCFMHRINCTSSTLCRMREECISSIVLQQYYAGASFSTQQLHLGSQQFNLNGSGDEYSGICICPRGYELTSSGVACLDRNECDEGTPCAVGAVCRNTIGSYECVCPPGTVGEPYTKTCEPVVKHECLSNLDCANDRECDQVSHKCVSPCKVCGPRAICTAANHAAICLCPPRYTGNAIDPVYGCQEPSTTTTTTTSTSTTSTTTSRPATPTTAVGVPFTTLLPQTTTVAPPQTTTPELVEFRTIPPSELFVMCLADGIQVEVQLGGFDGIIYVKGHSQDPKCRKLVMSNNANEFVDFKVQFGHCDLIHRDGEAGFVLVIQKHPKLVTYRARAYHVKCVYNTGERTVTLGFNVSMITTSGTIANTGPPPTCLMSITALDGREVTSAEIGQDLLLRVDVQPDSIYGGFARSCEAKTMDDEGEYQYEVTDANGCATDASIFSDWKYDQHRKSLVARFNAFKFPSSNNLRFQCNIRVCFGSCPAVNCNGIDAYGRRRRRRREAPALIGADGLNATDLGLDGPSDELIVTDAFKEGALREEIMVASNAILTFDRKEASLPQQRAQVEEIEFVCLPRLGVLVSILLTTLIALLILGIATSCWCFNKRKRQNKSNGPLPHPSEFPNPLLRAPSASTLREPIYGP